MSHHGNEDPELRKAMHESMKKVFGEFPDGKLNADDAGGIAISVRTYQGRVVIDFPKPIAWIGFTADEAVVLANLLIQHARQAGSTKPLTINIR